MEHGRLAQICDLHPDGGLAVVEARFLEVTDDEGVEALPLAPCGVADDPGGDPATSVIGWKCLSGDVSLTGTPGAVVIQDGDVAECRINGFEPRSCATAWYSN